MGREEGALDCRKDRPPRSPGPGGAGSGKRATPQAAALVLLPPGRFRASLAVGVACAPRSLRGARSPPLAWPRTSPSAANSCHPQPLPRAGGQSRGGGSLSRQSAHGARPIAVHTSDTSFSRRGTDTLQTAWLRPP